jgi:DNA repair protein RecN (Recombination protein N)
LINRYYLEDYLSFHNVNIEFKNGLIIFSGPSGAGKSIFMNSLLNLFAKNQTSAKLSEITLENLNIINEAFNISSDDDINIKQITNTKTRYFLNNQAIAKKQLEIFTKPFFKHLHLKDTSDFDSKNIVEFLDFLSAKNNKKYLNILNTFKDNYTTLKSYKDKYKKIIEDEKNIDDIRELTKLQIKKIEDINPNDGEYEELKDIKTMISKKEKIEESISIARSFLDNTHQISKALDILDIDSSFFDDSINEVNAHFDNFYDKLLNYDDMDIEQTLDRIENLSWLIKKYGSISEALEYKEKKKLELDTYENISFEKELLNKKINELEEKLNKDAITLSTYRKESLKILQNDINNYLKYLYLENLTISINDKKIDITGIDEISFSLNNINLSKISSGEFNRLRLALLTARSIYEIDSKGILFLDEIDANLSGKESESIAKVLEILSKNYQIFAISHQPQLSATAHQHFLIYKENGNSNIKELSNDERIDEISRMISGENITNEAREFAKKLLHN